MDADGSGTSAANNAADTAPSTTTTTVATSGNDSSSTGGDLTDEKAAAAAATTLPSHTADPLAENATPRSAANDPQLVAKRKLQPTAHDDDDGAAAGGGGDESTKVLKKSRHEVVTAADEVDELDDDDFDEDDDEEFEIERQRRKVAACQGFPKGYESDVNDSFDDDEEDNDGEDDEENGADEPDNVDAFAAAPKPSTTKGHRKPPTAALNLNDILQHPTADDDGADLNATASSVQLADLVGGVADDVSAATASAAGALNDDDLARQMLQDAMPKSRRRKRRRQGAQGDPLATTAGPSSAGGDDRGADDGDVDMEYELTQKLKDMGEISVQPVGGGSGGGKADSGSKLKRDYDLGDEVSLELSSKAGGDGDTDDKRKISNLRKNIREVMDDNQLDASTLAAQRQELERLARVQEQQRIIRDMQRQIAMERQNSKTQNRVLSLLQGKSSSLLKGLADGGAADALGLGTTSGQSSSSANLTPSVSIAPVRSAATAGSSSSAAAKRDPLAIDSSPESCDDAGDALPSADSALAVASVAPSTKATRLDVEDDDDDDIAMMTSSTTAADDGDIGGGVSAGPTLVDDVDDDEDEDLDDLDDLDELDDDDADAADAAAAKKEVVHIVDSSDDDCIMLSDDEEEPEDTDDPHNSGLHVNDAYNVPDDEGRVVVNIGHPDGEEDIFVAPQIARIMKPHQIGGVRFLFDNIIESVDRFASSTGFGCILAHSMGLGKTLQLVCFCDIFLRHTEAKTILCIMPINTLQNWMAEFNMWLPEEADKHTSRAAAGGGEVRARNFNLFVLNDTHKTLQARAKVVLDWAKNGGVLLMGYELYRLLSMKKVTKKRGRKGARNAELELEQQEAHKQLLDEMHAALVKPGPDLCVCDEGHRIKNSHAGISVALKQMRSKRRVVLTGYPLQNNLLEYWCMVDFVRPNYLGTKTEFSNMFERPILNGQCIDSTPQDCKLMRYRAHVLHSLLLGFVQRRSHVVLQNSLPRKEEFVLMVRMNEFQRKLYEVFMNEVVRTKAVPNPLKAFAVCCKIWNHPDVLYNFLKKREADLDLEEAEAAAADPSYEPESPVSGRGPAKKKGAVAAEKETKKAKAAAAAVTAAAATAAAATAAKAAAEAKAKEEDVKPEVVKTEVKTEGLSSAETKPPLSAGDVKFEPPQTTQQQQPNHPQQQHQQNPHHQPAHAPYNNPYPEPYGQYHHGHHYDAHNNYYGNNYNNYSAAPYPNYGQGYGQPPYPHQHQQNNAYAGQGGDYWHHQQQQHPNVNPNYYPGGGGEYGGHHPHHQQQQPHHQYNPNYPHGGYGAPGHDYNGGQHQPNTYNSYGQPMPPQPQPPAAWPAAPGQETAATSAAGATTAVVKTEEKFVNMDTNEIKLENPLSMNLDIAKIEDKPSIVKTESTTAVAAAAAPASVAGPASVAAAVAAEPNAASTSNSSPPSVAAAAASSSKEDTTASSASSSLDGKDASTAGGGAASAVAATATTTPAATATTAAAAKTVKGDDGIPYDWAVELMKNYVPDLISNSPKMEIFFCILEESLRLQDRLLVFSQSLLTLSLIEKFLQANNVLNTDQRWARNVNYYRLDGSTAAMEREKLINEFNVNLNVHLFLVSTRAGSLGINLVGANRVVVFDASWNPCHDTQAVCRVYRYGQKKPCFVYRLVMDSCLEKKIYDRQVNKQGMSDRVVDESNPDAHLSMKEVTNLCYYDEKEPEVQDFADCLEKYTDVAARQIITKFSHLMTKEPFQHETLLIDRKEKKLSMAEKRLAQRGYELEKQAALKPNFMAPGTVGGVQQQYRTVRRPDGVIVHRPVASVRPMQADGGVRTVVGGALAGNGAGGITRTTRWIPAEVWQRQGMTAQVLTLPGDVIIPTSSAEKSSIVLKEGQKVMVLKSPKGIYMQLESGKIIAIRTAFKMGGQSKEKTVTATGATATPSGLLGRDFTPRPRTLTASPGAAAQSGVASGNALKPTAAVGTTTLQKNTVAVASQSRGAVRPFGPNATAGGTAAVGTTRPMSLLQHQPKGRPPGNHQHHHQHHQGGPASTNKTVQLGTARPYNLKQPGGPKSIMSSSSSCSNSSSSFDGHDAKSGGGAGGVGNAPIAIVDDDVTEVESDSEKSETTTVQADDMQMLDEGQPPPQPLRQHHPHPAAGRLEPGEIVRPAGPMNAGHHSAKDDDVIMVPTPAAKPEMVPNHKPPGQVTAWDQAPGYQAVGHQPYAQQHQPQQQHQHHPSSQGYGGYGGPDAKHPPQHYPQQQHQPPPYAYPVIGEQSHAPTAATSSASYNYPPERKQPHVPAQPSKPPTINLGDDEPTDVPLREKVIYKPNLVERKPRGGTGTTPGVNKPPTPNQPYRSGQSPAIPFQPHKMGDHHAESGGPPAGHHQPLHQPFLSDSGSSSSSSHQPQQQQQQPQQPQQHQQHHMHNQQPTPQQPQHMYNPYAGGSPYQSQAPHPGQQQHHQQQQQHPPKPNSLKNYRHNKSKSSPNEQPDYNQPPSQHQQPPQHQQQQPPQQPPQSPHQQPLYPSQHHPHHPQQQHQHHQQQQHHSDASPMRYPPSASPHHHPQHHPHHPHQHLVGSPYGPPEPGSGPGPSSLSFLERTASSIHERPSAFNSTLNDITRPPPPTPTPMDHPPHGSGPIPSVGSVSSGSNSASTSPQAPMASSNATNPVNHYQQHNAGQTNAGSNNHHLHSNSGGSTPKPPKPKSRAPKKPSASKPTPPPAPLHAPMPPMSHTIDPKQQQQQQHSQPMAGKEKPLSKAGAKKAAAAAKHQQQTSAEHSAAVPVAVAAPPVVAPPTTSDPYGPYGHYNAPPVNNTAAAPAPHQQQQQQNQHQQQQHHYQQPYQPQQHPAAPPPAAPLHQPYAPASQPHQQQQQANPPLQPTLPPPQAPPTSQQPHQQQQPQHQPPQAYGNYPPSPYGSYPPAAAAVAPPATPTSDPYGQQQQQQQPQQQQQQHLHQSSSQPLQHHGYDAYNMGYPPYQQQPPAPSHHALPTPPFEQPAYATPPINPVAATAAAAIPQAPATRAPPNVEQQQPQHGDSQHAAHHHQQPQQQQQHHPHAADPYAGYYNQPQQHPAPPHPPPQSSVQPPTQPPPQQHPQQHPPPSTHPHQHPPAHHAPAQLYPAAPVAYGQPVAPTQYGGYDPQAYAQHPQQQQQQQHPQQPPQQHPAAFSVAQPQAPPAEHAPAPYAPYHAQQYAAPAYPPYGTQPNHW